MKYTPASIVTQGTESSTDATERRVLSRKALAKEKRQAAYQSAKARRSTDPRYLAMKEAAKLQRRATYQKAKDHRKVVAADAKAKRKAECSAKCASRRHEADRELMKLVTFVIQGSAPQND